MTQSTETVTWEGHAASVIARRCGLERVELFAETDSTLDVAHALAAKGAPAGTLVVAEAQRAGRGRMGRSWSSEPGRGVWCTVIERPSDAKALDVLSLRVGLRLAEALDPFVADRVGVKWPNDLVLRPGGESKLGGILVEARWGGATLEWVAVGVGVNVMAPRDVPDAAGLGAGVQRIDVLTAIVGAIRSAAAATGELSPSEIERYRDRDVLVGRRIVAPAVGTVTGIAATGALVVRTADGSELHRTGTIRFAEDS
jgi:BirA family transcriptional regulator, biotin operon repressor / biotin---[acetyl-CoA-carboxylase] ligase